jgi:predicted GNAT family acetyltransferase
LQIKLVQTKEDASKLYDLLATISEFNTSKESKEEFIQGKMTSINMGTTMVLEEDGKFVSTVATTAETTKDAMVVGVATHKDYRKKGYASILMSALMKRYFNDLHKDLCLFYDNPKAGKIYLRMGFKDIGKWVMYEPK